MPKDPAPATLFETEASHLLTQAIPGALVLHLRRESTDGGGGSTKRMFIELTVSEAVQHWRHVGDLIRKAGAMERQSAHADASPNL